MTTKNGAAPTSNSFGRTHGECLTSTAPPGPIIGPASISGRAGPTKRTAAKAKAPTSGTGSNETESTSREVAARLHADRADGGDRSRWDHGGRDHSGDERDLR